MPDPTDLADDAEVRRALEDRELRERLFATQAPSGLFLRRVGAYAEPTYRDVDFNDWNGAVVGRGTEIDRAAVAPDASLPFAAFAALAAMGPFARSLVAAHPSTPAHVLAELAEDDDERVQAAIVVRVDLDDTARRRLAKTQFAGVRERLAVDRALPRDVIELLRHDPAPNVRAVVAGRAGLDPVWIQELASDGDANVRYAIAKRADVDHASIARLARDPAPGVRRAIAARADIDHALLFALAPDSEVALTIASRTDLDSALFEELAAHASAGVVAKLVRSPLVTPAHLARFADIDESVVASHPKTPPEALARIAARSDRPRVLRAVAEHLATPTEVLVRLLDRPDVGPVVAARRGLAHSVAERCARHRDRAIRDALAANPTIDEAMATLLANDADAYVRATLAKNPGCTLLADLATDPMATVREAIARRSDAPVAVLEVLARDQQTLVRDGARKTLEAKARKP